MLVAAVTAVLGIATGAAGPAARWWGRRNGHTGNLKSLLLKWRQGTNSGPEKVPVHVFPPPATKAQERQEAKAQGSALAAALRAEVKPEDTVLKVAVPAGTRTEILRAEWLEA
jgi:hypothetical protein